MINKINISVTILIVSLFSFSSCYMQKVAEQHSDREDFMETKLLRDNTQELLSTMIGSYNSSKQAELDTNYYNISLYMYPIWENSNDGYKYLYVEQALSSMQDKPYRQRVYRLKYIGENNYESSVFKLPNEENYIGKYNTPIAFSLISPKDLLVREGCAVYLSQKGNKFIGSTREKMCKSTMRGASYATSFVNIFPDRVESWDQGFDVNDKQVWGAENGGYIFEKLNTKQ